MDSPRRVYLVAYQERMGVAPLQVERRGGAMIIAEKGNSALWDGFAPGLTCAVCVHRCEESPHAPKLPNP